VLGRRVYHCQRSRPHASPRSPAAHKCRTSRRLCLLLLASRCLRELRRAQRLRANTRGQPGTMAVLRHSSRTHYSAGRRWRRRLNIQPCGVLDIIQTKFLLKICTRSSRRLAGARTRFMQRCAAPSVDSSMDCHPDRRGRRTRPALGVETPDLYKPGR
jgi:hypothetical protein